MAIGAILGVAQAGMGIASAIGGYNSKADQIRAQNEAMMEQYDYQLQIRDKKYKDALQVYGTKRGQADLMSKAADRAAAAAYGAVDFNRSERTKQATAQLMNDYLGMAKKGGSAAASGKTGNNAADLDADQESNLVRKEKYRLAGLLAGDAADMMKRTQIANQLNSQQNQIYGSVAIAPNEPMMPLEPTQLSAPSKNSMYLGIGSSLLQGANTFSSMMAPDPGDFGGTGSYADTSTPLTNLSSSYNDMSSWYTF